MLVAKVFKAHINFFTPVGELNIQNLKMKLKPAILSLLAVP
jgi:hypothetical protein